MATTIRDRIVGFKRVKASQLVANPNNWRLHNEAQRSTLQDLLTEVGIADALICRKLPDGRLEIIDGHLRQDTDPNLMWPVLILDVDEAEANKLLVSIDPLAAMASPDLTKLQALLGGAATESANIALMWERQVVDAQRLDDLARTAEALRTPGQRDEDEVPEPPKVPIARRGDLWLLGEHRLLCGNSGEPDDVARLMDGHRADLMNTDPPYGVNYGDIANSRARAADKRNGGSGKDYSTHDDKHIQNDDLDGAALRVFLEKMIQVALPHLSETPAFYLWHPMLTQGVFFAAAAAAAANILIHRQIIWVKPSLIMGRGDYHWRHELCFYGWIQGKRCPWLMGRNQDTVWNVGRENDRIHPTQKPVELFRRPLLNHVPVGGLCYEPYAGSGSQFIAAEATGRRCYGMEIDPIYIDVIVLRWEAFTGKKATCIRPRAKRK